MKRRHFSNAIGATLLSIGLFTAMAPTDSNAAPEKATVTVQIYPGSMLNVPLHVGVDHEDAALRRVQRGRDVLCEDALADAAFQVRDADPDRHGRSVLALNR